MAIDERQQIEELLYLYRRRKHELDKRAALLGSAADPSIALERQDIAREIAKLERRRSYLAGGYRPVPEPSASWHDHPPDNIQAGLATSVTALVIAAVLWFAPPYLGRASVGASAVFGCLSVFGLGTELNKIARPGVWNNIGTSAALCIAAATVYHYLGTLPEALVLLSVVLLAALYTFSLAVFNAVSRR